MRKKAPTPSSAGLFRFGMTCLRAERYPHDHHPCTVFACPTCGVVPLAPIIEHHTGSQEGSFRGVIKARCSTCGREERVFSFTGEHRRPLRVERPTCPCGHGGFLIGMVERIEGDRGLPGFFDEGVVVGECAECGQRTAFVHTD